MENQKKIGKEMSFLDHLEELRWHLVRSVIAVMAGGVFAFINKGFFFDKLLFYPKQTDFPTYKFFCNLTQGVFGGEGILCMEEFPFTLLNTKMAGQFSTHIWVSLIIGFIIAFPYVIYEFWKFLKPALHANEVRMSKLMIFFVSLLFGLGVLFGYYLIVPLSIQFLGGYSISAEINNLIDLTSYISTVTTVTLACGIIFELPVFVYFLVALGVITPEDMRKYRKHSIVGILILAAIITPPDISSQILVTMPVMILYEISIVVGKMALKKKATTI